MDEPQQQACGTIISCLANMPVLVYTDQSLPCEQLTDDPSNVLDAVLNQEQNGKKKFLAYASRSLKIDEKTTQLTSLSCLHSSGLY